MSLFLAATLALSTTLTIADTHPLRAGDTLYGYGTDAVLGELFDYDDAAAPETLCFIGEAGQNRVCAVLSQLSRNDVAAYESGDHVLTKLTSCRVAGRGKGVVARIAITHDWETETVVRERTIDRCE